MLHTEIAAVYCDKHKEHIHKYKIYIGCFKKSFNTLKAYRNLYRGHTQRFELSKCSKKTPSFT
jgi:hypothetical protein